MSVSEALNSGRGRPPSVPVRKATDADAGPVARMMARAFFADPIINYMFPEEAVRRRKLEPLFSLLFQSNHALDGCDVTGDCESAGMWRPPGHWHISNWEILRNLGKFLAVYGLSPRRVFAVLSAMERAHPREPHWYLMVLGTDPDRQGQGYGGITVRHRLAQIDAEHMPAYLEASKPSNVPVYTKFGFVQTGEITFPNGPTVYPMWREAR
jgi:GNAT superfamily N-acetyltransferase